MSLVVAVAQAVVDALNAHAFSMGFTAKRLYQPIFDLEEMNRLHVTVVPKAMTTALASRQACHHEVSVDVAVQKKIRNDTNTEPDNLIALSEEIATHFERKRLEAMPEASWIKTEHQPVYSLEHMDELRQFTGVITFTFQVTK